MTMTQSESLSGRPVREPVLNPVDRVSELLFGLFMALSFTGAVSVADSGREEVRSMFTAALGCNLAWGLVDAVMYLVRTLTERAKAFTLVVSVRSAADPEAGRRFIERSLSRPVAKLFSPVELEAIRGRIVALTGLPARPRLRRDDLLASLAIFLLVVASTFPVVLPFALIGDVGTAMTVSRVIALAMLFWGGFALGHYAGYGSWRFGFMMVGVGAALVGAIMALGG
jgi:VIT1/CCC1 family predicted Fe2+/Mn2+ transporter